MRLRNRPWKLVLGATFGTFAQVLVGADLLDGEVHFRRYGTIAVGENPGGFGAFVLCYLLFWAFIVFLWFVLRDEWSLDYRSPMKPEFYDPEKSRPFTPVQSTVSLSPSIERDEAKQ
ncbi:hypothetical protein [Sphingomonas mucosissima]|uniref:Uncharacterized protein n=1 Tax=Sphingomonas mucosissima TaxID=370959 RepID=A0A245ZM06_9SPHN|nr:hypothetical protein [Sphingomonas mucosissima]OWK30774.1 hypothetical protein SPMU_17630 [Sphingomonas mucosissima]